MTQKKPLDEMTLGDLAEALWPALSGEQREAIITAQRKLGMLDTWSESPGGRTETTFHAEAYEALEVLSNELHRKRPDDPYVAELFKRYGHGKQRSL